MLEINKIIIFNTPYIKNVRKVFSSYLEKIPKKDIFESSTIDILSKGKYPANVLSNFHESKFKFDGIQINSMEGLLQSLKTPDVEKQKKICLLVGKDAKKAGESLADKFDGKNIYWLGNQMDRNSEEYKHFLEKVYKAKYFQDSSFRDALDCSKGKKLIHSIGKHNTNETILTEEEFINNLENLRNK